MNQNPFIMKLEEDRRESSLMSRLGVFRDQKILTDVTLRTENEEFKAHKIILACYSDYFYALFTNSMIESKTNEVLLSILSTKGLKVILDYIYKSTMNICMENVVDVLHAASYLQIESAIIFCDLFLRKHINNDNVLDIINIADTYSLSELKKWAHMHLAANLSKIVDFYKLSPAQMDFFLTSEFLIDISECKLLEFLLHWFFVGTEKEMTFKLNKADELIRRIIFSDITSKQLCEVIAKIFPIESIRKNHIIYKIILEQKFLSETIEISSFLTNPENIRGLKKAFIMVGGICNTGITNELSYMFDDENKWRSLTTIPHIDQCNFGTSVHKNMLYVIGGCYNEFVEEILHPYAFCYDPRRDQWKTLQSMRIARCRFTLTVLEDNLYAIGGCMDTDNICTNPIDDGSNLCDKYIISSNKWENIAPLPQSLCQHAACTITLKSKEYLFISGGLHCGNVMDKVYTYDALQNTWCSKADLIIGRADHSIFQYKNKLYICGGWNHGIDNISTRQLIPTIDMYDPEEDTWTTIARKAKPTFHCSIVMNDSKIYFIGGFNHNNEFSRKFEFMEYYDIETNCWTVTEQNPEIWEHNSVMMFIPKTYR